MNQNPTVSVIIPCYNSGEYIDAAVDSILSQTFQDFEIIIINDGSTDENTKRKLHNYNKPKTTVIHTENKGLAAARNTGFKASKGTFIQFLDSDDIIEKSKFQEQLEIFNNNHIDICYSDFSLFDLLNGRFISFPENRLLTDLPLKDLLLYWERGLCIPIHCALFKREIWEDRKPFNEKLKAREDWVMWCELASRGKSFYYVNKKLAVYRHHENNMSKNFERMNFYYFMAVFYILQIIPEEYKEEFLFNSLEHNNVVMKGYLFKDLENQIIDLKTKFEKMDKTIDFKIGHVFLKPYRYLKQIFLGKKYL